MGNYLTPESDHPQLNKPQNALSQPYQQQLYGDHIGLLSQAPSTATNKVQQALKDDPGTMPWDPMLRPKLGAFCSGGSDWENLIERNNSIDLRRSKLFNFGDSIDIPQGSIERPEPVKASVPSLFKGLVGGVLGMSGGLSSRESRNFG